MAASALAGWAEALQPPEVVACYVGVGTEPPTLALVEALGDRGVRVLLPVVAAGGALDWAAAPAAGRSGASKASGAPGALLASGRLGLLEPPGPYLGSAALDDVGLVLIPALAVDRAGNRLGRGGGYYDRALARLSRTTRVLAVVFDDEVVDEVPVEAHDLPVGGALTPSGPIMFAPA